MFGTVSLILSCGLKSVLKNNKRISASSNFYLITSQNVRNKRRELNVELSHTDYEMRQSNIYFLE